MIQHTTLAALQCPLPNHGEENIEQVLELARQAVAAGADVVLPPELFEGPYFCKEQSEAAFEWATELDQSPAVTAFQKFCAEFDVAVPVSFFEKCGQAYYNSVALVLPGGEVSGIYRKSHIPDGPGYQEKYYFRPGDTGFQVWETPFGALGVGICWDQWFPEAARAMTLQGAEFLLYPTAIGSEPADPEQDTKDPWQRAMLGHAVSNATVVVAANRIGEEQGQSFYGSSFIADPRGDKVAELGRDETGFIVHTFDRQALEKNRAAWGFFRDRRPELYGALATADGQLEA